MRGKISVYLIIILSFTGQVFSQYNENNIPVTKHYPVIELKFHTGKIVKNYSEIPDRKQAYLFELMLGEQTNGNKSWQQIYGLPQTGLSFIYGQLGNKGELGNVFGIVPNLTFNTVRQKIWNVKVTLGIGLAYFNKPFNKETNPENKLIGSAITNMSFASAYFQFNLSPSFSTMAGITSLHCSNGHYQVPNVGLNMQTLNLGLKYYLNGKITNYEPKETEVPKGIIKKNIRIGVGIHEFAKTTGPVGGPKYPIYITSFYLSKRYGKVSNVHAGIELKHYASYYNYIADSSLYENKERLNATVFTFFMAHELMVGRLSLVTQGGLDLFNPFYARYYKETVGTKNGLFRFLETVTSTRLGLQYYVFDTKFNNARNLFFGIYIKANFGQADFLCMDIGFTF